MNEIKNTISTGSVTVDILFSLNTFALERQKELTDYLSKTASIFMLDCDNIEYALNKGWILNISFSEAHQSLPEVNLFKIKFKYEDYALADEMDQEALQLLKADVYDHVVEAMGGMKYKLLEDDIEGVGLFAIISIGEKEKIKIHFQDKSK